MNARKLFDNESYIYMERYVNDGSPSGFTELHTTSSETNPFWGETSFPLLEFFDGDSDYLVIGASNKYFSNGVNYAHPDSLCSKILRDSNRVVQQSMVVVAPTSGGRTMLLNDSNVSGYLKLTYDVSRIGRVDRQLTWKHCMGSLEASEVLKKCIDADRFPSFLSVQLEPSAKVSKLRLNNETYEWGTIFREKRAYPYTKKNIQLVPGFSLFGKDKKHVEDKVLILQFIEEKQCDPQQYLVHLLKMIVDCYWSVVLECAFHIECHGQNCFFEVDDEYNIVRMVIKDMDSVDKDLPLAKYFGYNYQWDSYPQQCFDENIYFYNIRASFMYDYKLGEYLLTPIIKVVADEYNLNTREIENEIKEYAKLNYTWKLPDFYFPQDGCWYNCANTERIPGQRREYFPNKNPKFR